jgi:hypothetical protein
MQSERNSVRARFGATWSIVLGSSPPSVLADQSDDGPWAVDQSGDHDTREEGEEGKGGKRRSKRARRAFVIHMKEIRGHEVRRQRKAETTRIPSRVRQSGMPNTIQWRFLGEIGLMLA